MRITAVRETAVPIRSTIRNAVFDFSEMTTSIVAVVTDVVRQGRPIVGYAFNSTGRYACGAQMRDRFIPRILRAKPETLLDEEGTNLDPAKILACMTVSEKPGAHAERSIGIGTIETAVWDAVAKIEDRPLHQVLADRFNGGVVSARVFCYVGGGWYRPGGTLDDLRSELERHLAAGYTMVKIKVGGLPLADDLRRIETALDVVGGSEHLAVDANAKFSPEEALAYAGALAPYRLRWFEEPVDPLDFESLARLARGYEPSLATGENLYSPQEVMTLVAFGGLRSDRDVIQVDPPQAYGYGTYVRTAAMLESRGWSRASLWPHGGNQMSLAAVAGLGLGGCEAYPGVFGIFAGYADDAKVENGYLTPSDRPGIGFEGQAALYEAMRALAP